MKRFALVLAGLPLVAACGSAPDSGDAGTDGGVGNDAITSDDSPAQSLDHYGPWAGAYADPTFFPISVWLQDPSLAAQYQAIGVNQYIGLYNGPTSGDLTTLTTANMPAYCDQNSVGLANLGSKAIAGWTQEDEPDNAQPDGKGGYGPCISPTTIQNLYQTMKTKDPSRPVFLNVGQGVANDAWVGRGSCSGQASDYAEYAKGCDIISFDVYPINSGLDITLVATGVDRLGQDVNHMKHVWNWIECTQIDAANTKPTTDQVKAEVWMSIIHGSTGIGYFVHKFTPTEDDHELLDDAPMKAAVMAIDQQVHDLAPALNTPPITNAVTVASPGKVDTLVLRQGGKLYVLAVSMTNGTTTATFTLTHDNMTTATVLGETRTVPVAQSAFQDSFSAYAAHLYSIQ